MLCSISKINIPIPYSRKKVNIQLDGRSLIITGGNGCGKTSFITAIYNYLKKGIDDPNNNSIEYLMNQIDNYKRQMENIGRDGGHYNYYKNELEKNKARLEEINNFNIETDSIDNKDIRSLLRFHSATRQTIRNLITKSSAKTLCSY
ncbi:AAA family ATPase [Citrobacter amalonaticus]|uniref:AAA family ATPase n=1 Tax=Citrobacter amalonaticus TaxID=35703 RepID=UPI0021562AD8|nr:AAA family ATPase [Citrobacter amalonaticus]